MLACFAFIDSCSKSQLDLGTCQEEDVLENSVDELKDRELGLGTTMAKMFNSEMVDVACFARFHLM